MKSENKLNSNFFPFRSFSSLSFICQLFANFNFFYKEKGFLKLIFTGKNHPIGVKISY
jgi:hypothetical protein